MFYALEQAGQAITAAYLTEPPRQAHGLKASGYEKPVHEVTIESKGDGAFQAVARALDVPGISSAVTLGALWASLPEGVGEEFEGAEYPTAIAVYPEDSPRPAAFLTMTDAARAWLFPLPARVLVASAEERVERVAAHLTNYPSASGWESPIDGGIPARQDAAAGYGIRLQWRLPNATGSAWERFEYLLTKIAPRYDVYRRGVMRPAVDGRTVLHPLLTWWLLLYALSMFARYRPGAWVKHLDVTTSKDAVRLETLLTESLKSVPRLVLEALTREPSLDYAG